MSKLFVYIKEILFIFAAMLAPLVLWLAASLIQLKLDGDSVRFGSASGEMTEGFIITTLIFVVPATLLFWLLLKLFQKGNNLVSKARILLAVIAACTIVGTLLLFNFTNTPEWFAFAAVPIGVLVFAVSSKSDKESQEI